MLTHRSVPAGKRSLIPTHSDCLKRMETILTGMKQMRGYVATGSGQEMLESLIEEAELQIADVKGKMVL